MQVEKQLAQIKPQQEAMVSIGVFDGVHLGHRRLLTHLRDEAKSKNRLSVVVTFKSHPEVVLGGRHRSLWLNDLETRINLIRGIGIDIVIALPFSAELAQLTARKFVELLKEHLKMRGLIVGPDFALGRNREGDAEKLRSLGKEMDFTVEVIPTVVVDGIVVSSSTIRQALADGDMKKVEKLTGRLFSLTGHVVSGDRRGRELGFPTANLNLTSDQALPADGIYATITHAGAHPLPSVTNIGVRPTFGGKKRLVETYILDFEGDLLGQQLTIDMVEKVRDEERFETVEALKARIVMDIEQTRKILGQRME